MKTDQEPEKKQVFFLRSGPLRWIGAIFVLVGLGMIVWGLAGMGIISLGPIHVIFTMAGQGILNVAGGAIAILVGALAIRSSFDPDTP